MARRGGSTERKIAESLVDAFLKTGKGRNGGKIPPFFSLITVLLVTFGFVWVSGFQSEDTSDGYENDSASVVSGDLGFVGSGGRFSVPKEEEVTIERCVDGDTLIVITSDGVRERVRLIGANTPETVKKNTPIEPFGPEASAYTKQRVEEAGYKAVLAADGATYDKYNRRLAFVYLGDDTVSLNEDLCRHGLARAETKYSFSKVMKERLTAAAEAAEREGLGIYSLAE